MSQAFRLGATFRLLLLRFASYFDSIGPACLNLHLVMTPGTNVQARYVPVQSRVQAWGEKSHYVGVSSLEGLTGPLVVLL